MGLAAKRFLQGALRQRLEHGDPVIPMKSVVIENEARSSSGALLPMNIRSIRITHQSIEIPPPILKIFIEQFQFQNHNIQGTMNPPEKLRNICPKPTIANSTITKKAVRDNIIGSDKGTRNSKNATEAEIVLSSPIPLQTLGNESSHSASDQASGKKQRKTPNRKHEITATTIPRSDAATTETKTNRSETEHDTLGSASSNLRKESTPKELKTHCNEGSYWAIGLSGKKRRNSNRHSIQNTHGQTHRQTSASSNLHKDPTPKELKIHCSEGSYSAIDLSGKKRSNSNRHSIQNTHVQKQLQSHCAEGRYWEINLSSNKRKRSPSIKLMESSLERETKRKKRTRSAPPRR